MISVEVYRRKMDSPDDISELRKLIKDNDLDPNDIVAVLGKTEGNGCVNDFTRGYATQSFSRYISDLLGKDELEIKKQIAFVMSGGTEGVMSPHFTVFSSREEDIEINSKEKSLVVVSGFTRDFLPEEQGTLIQVDEVAKVVKQLMKKAKIDDPNDVHFVQIKCPLLTSERINEANSRGKKVVTHDTYESMGYNRGASAIGVGVALGEIDREKLDDNTVMNDFTKYSGVASTSGGIELLNCEIILMGNSFEGNGKYYIEHDVMKDAIDSSALYRVLKKLGIDEGPILSEQNRNRIVNVFAKAESASNGFCRDRRTTLHTDSDINHTRHARAVVNGVLASIIGDPMIYVSGGSEHQGPDGGGPVAVIVKR